MFDFLKKFNLTSLDAPAPRTHVVAPREPALNIKKATGGALRNGMWVVVGDQVGILTALDVHGTAIVMLTDAEGGNIPTIVDGVLTNQRLQIPVTQVRRAEISEIPAKRVSHLQHTDLNAMGYE